MRTTPVDRAGFSRIDASMLPRVMIWSVIAAIVSSTVAHPDLWGHVKFGMDIIAQRGLPSIDPYSFTTDQPWTNHEWLSEVLMGGTFQLAGPIGLALLKFTILVATLVLIARDFAARRVPGMTQDALLMVMVIGCVMLTKTLRPQTFSFLLFASMVVALRRAEDGEPRLLSLNPPILAAWANMHGGWLVGVGVLGLWCAVRCVRPLGAARWVWAATGLASLAATLATPDGLSLWSFLWKTVGLGRPDITEWQPLTGLPLVDSLPWALTAVVAVAATKRSLDRRASHLAVVALLMFVSFRVWRVVPFFAIATAILLGPGLAPASRKTRPAAPLAAKDLLLLGVLCATFFAGSAIYSVRSLGCISMTGGWIADRQATGSLMQSGLTGTMLTWFDWGEYAIWFLSPRIKVSMDGRRETVYSDPMLFSHLAIYYGWDGWQDQLRQLAPDHIWLPKVLVTVDQIEPLGWKPILTTAESIVFSRTAAPLSPWTRSGASCFPGAP